jgi:type IV secretion system protein VirD4
MANTGEKAAGGDDFWNKAESLLYTSLVAMILQKFPPAERNFGKLLGMLDTMQAREANDGTFRTDLDYMFETWEKEHGSCFATRQYAKFKLAAARTASSILISCAVRLAPFEVEEIKNLTAYDELNFETIGDEKTAIFFIISDTDDTFNFLVGLAYTQMFRILTEKADSSPGGHLKIHVRCLLDEVANIGQIPHLEKLIATVRSREISICLLLQTRSQLKALYKDHTETIIGNCDSVLFLGGRERGTLEEISQMMGKETVMTQSHSESYGQNKSTSRNNTHQARSLMSMDELAVMPGDMCILLVRGLRPFYSEKYRLEEHPRYFMLRKAKPFILEREMELDPEDEIEIFLN